MRTRIFLGHLLHNFATLSLGNGLTQLIVVTSAGTMTRMVPTASVESNWCISDGHFSWLNDIPIKIKLFLESWDKEIWYKTFNLHVFIFLWSKSLNIWKIQWLFHLIIMNVYIKSHYLRIPLLIKMTLIHEKTFVWNASIWVRGACKPGLMQRSKITAL